MSADRFPSSLIRHSLCLSAALAALVGLVALAGCTPTPAITPGAPADTAQPTGRAPAVAPSRPTPTSLARPPLATSRAITTEAISLVWWTPEFLSPVAGQPGGPVLASALEEFQAAQKGRVTVDPVLKTRYGKGGLLDLMRTALPVAPGILPDLVSLDTGELEQAAALGLLQPLDKLLSPELLAGLYPFARQTGQFDGRLLAVPIMADVEHVAIREGTVPATWADLISGKASYLFPLANPPASAGSQTETVQNAFVSQYLSAGGTIDLASRRLVLQEEPLTRVLSFYREARAAGALPAGADKMATLEECWKQYADGTVAMAEVSARRYLAGRPGLKQTAYAAIPGNSGPAAPVASGWALAIVTRDPVRQRAAADLIARLLVPDYVGAWTQAAGWLPVTPLAWSRWERDPYYEFLDRQLAAAVSRPVGLDGTQTASLLRQAQTAALQEGTNLTDIAQKTISSAAAK